MNRIVPIGLMIMLTITGCTGPGGLFGSDDEIEEPFVYDLTIENLWADIPENMTAASDIINMTYELEKSPRVTNFTEIGYSINSQPLLFLNLGIMIPQFQLSISLPLNMETSRHRLIQLILWFAILQEEYLKR